mmetsp:Transcript_5627/g.18570  ORF Transcript_5627/g.18570 Transcript_5627/m.18570 type:complete len:82 (+) Transcript_5627:3489-3734(+)
MIRCLVYHRPGRVVTHTGVHRTLYSVHVSLYRASSSTDVGTSHRAASHRDDDDDDDDANARERARGEIIERARAKGELRDA